MSKHQWGLFNFFQLIYFHVFFYQVQINRTNLIHGKKNSNLKFQCRVMVDLGIF
jgi:hypothetical protein